METKYNIKRRSIFIQGPPGKLEILLQKAACTARKRPKHGCKVLIVKEDET